MRYLSVCSGIEAATVAWKPLGWTPVAFAEIDPFCCRLLKHHYPEVPNLGDFTKIGEEWRGKYDLLVGGTPCQDFSNAGKRAGFEGARGTLTYAFAELVQRTMPAWFVWENVPGVCEGKFKEGFIGFIDMLASFGYCVAWRVIDAQYCRVDGFERAVPQRRRRVFVVGSFGNVGSSDVLFERAGLRRDFAAGSNARENDSQKAGRCAQERGVWGAITADYGDKYNCDNQSIDNGNIICCDESSSTLSAQTPGKAKEKSDYSKLIAYSINTQNMARGPVGDSAGHAIGSKDSPSFTITRKHHHAVAYENNLPLVQREMSVRRLTPIECERLMGFPDNYTNIPGASDSARYKSCGNSMAVNCMRWIGRRIEKVNTKREG